MAKTNNILFGKEFGMITIIILCLLILVIKITIKILPAIIGLSFSLFIVLFQAVGFILLVPTLGILFVALDVCALCVIVWLIKAIVL